MCYKNFAPLGLEYKMHARLQEFRPAGARMQNTFGSTRISPRWGYNAKYMWSTRISPRWGSNKKCCSAFQLQRSVILVENN